MTKAHFLTRHKRTPQTRKHHSQSALLPSANPTTLGWWTSIAFALSLGCALSDTTLAEKKPAPAPNGMEFISEYRNWQVISISHRTDLNSMRAILGNDTAVAAARSGKTNPWPEGTILSKVVWKQTAEEYWPTAIAPADFVQVEFMQKDSKKWAATGGWGYGRWLGTDLTPYGESAEFANECVACHTPVKHRDWVYTNPALMPNGVPE